MELPLSDFVVAFDLDDTLYKEADFLKSGYKQVALALCGDNGQADNLALSMLHWYKSEENVLEKAITATNSKLDIPFLLNIYRGHFPDIKLDLDCAECLQKLLAYGAVLSIITDGRTLTQCNKIRALGLNGIVSAQNIIISEQFGSEKPSAANYKAIEIANPGKKFCYVGDNPVKDFVTANSLDWLTIGLRDNGCNIHGQDAELRDAYQPSKWIDNISELPELLLQLQ